MIIHIYQDAIKTRNILRMTNNNVTDIIKNAINVIMKQYDPNWLPPPFLQIQKKKCVKALKKATFWVPRS